MAQYPDLSRKRTSGTVPVPDGSLHLHGRAFHGIAGPEVAYDGNGMLRRNQMCRLKSACVALTLINSELTAESFSLHQYLYNLFDGIYIPREGTTRC